MIKYFYKNKSQSYILEIVSLSKMIFFEYGGNIYILLCR